MKQVAVGIVTYKRPDYFSKCLRGAIEHLSDIADLYVYNDGSPLGDYRRIYDRWNRSLADIEHSDENRGVAAAKNRLLQRMLDGGYTYIFTLEDDIVPQSPEAVSGYIAAAEASGVHHLNFHAHGDVNENQAPVRIDGPVTYWPGLTGAYSLFTREVLTAAGLLDEGFYNAWEHFEHYCRISRTGLGSPFQEFADATGSERWLAEIPGSFHPLKRSIRYSSLQEWRAHQEKQLDHWRQVYAREGLPMPITMVDGVAMPADDLPGEQRSSKRRGLLRRRASSP